MLGEQDPLLLNRGTNRCAGLPLPAVTEFTYTEESVVTLSADGFEPEVANINTEQAVVLYRKTGAAALFYRVLTLNADYTIDLIAEDTLVSVPSGTLQGYAVSNVDEDHVLVAYNTAASTRVLIGTYSAGVITWGTESIVNAEMNPASITSQLQICKITNSKYLLAARNSDNGKPCLQVINVDTGAGYAITNGTVHKANSHLNAIGTVADMLTASKGILAWEPSGVGRVSTLAFTVTADVVTFAGTGYIFPNATQFPTATNRGLIYPEIRGIDANTALLVGQGSTAISGVTLIAPMFMFVSESSDVLTSTTALHDSVYEHAAGGGNTFPRTLFENNDMMVAHVNHDSSPRVFYFTKLVDEGGTPAISYDVELDTKISPLTYRNPEFCFMGGFNYLMVVDTTEAGANIQATAIRAT